MRLFTDSSPHIRSTHSTSRIMLDVAVALLPALAVGILILGLRALWVVLLCLGTAVVTEGLCSAVLLRRSSLRDGSAIVTGLLLGMTLPHTVPFWLAAAGSAFAIVISKVLCGGLGQNVFNPALSARALMVLLCPSGMVAYFAPGSDIVTAATPLHHMVRPELPAESLWDLFVGRCSGSIGELSTLALLLGGGYLMWRKVISWRIPTAFLGTVAVLTLLFYKTEDSLLWAACQLCSGGLMLAAFFMATDYASSPVTPKGQLLYGVGCGILTVLLRYHGLFPEGITYAILLMNAAAWWIDRHTAPRRFGDVKEAT
ncbi:MAG: RnfABCDGE type electron transport complex subunit D [Ruminococcaceae bacterium]|nr:RnfABCDGE type electron transport complex subunit D [Oscillospiraceae bacterium]